MKWLQRNGWVLAAVMLVIMIMAFAFDWACE